MFAPPHHEIVLEKRGITADTALRLARYSAPPRKCGPALQADYDLARARYQKAKANRARRRTAAVLDPALA